MVSSLNHGYLNAGREENCPLCRFMVTNSGVVLDHLNETCTIFVTPMIRPGDDLFTVYTQAAKEAGVPFSFNRVGSMFTSFFTYQKVKDFTTAKTSDTAKFGKFFLSMLRNGVNLAPSQFEAAFMSLAHTERDIDQTIEAARKSLLRL